jgi:hypothetical protein
MVLMPSSAMRIELAGSPSVRRRTVSVWQIRGARTEADLEAAQYRLLGFLDEIGLEVPDYSFERRTTVFMEDLDRSIDLE